jgi:LPS sulfotransferase NodH
MDKAVNSQRKGYAICTVGRSGSNWLCQFLASTDVLGYPLEYFNTTARRQLTQPDYPDDPAEQIQKILTLGTTSNGIYALKVFPVQIDAVASNIRWTEMLPNLSFVHWSRRDILGQALSHCRAIQTSQFRSRDVQLAEPSYNAQHILNSLAWLVKQQARWELFFARTGIRPLRLTYEDAVNDPQLVCEAISRLLQLEIKPKPDFRKVDMLVQRDDLSAEWRTRFQSDMGNPNFIGDF